MTVDESINYLYGLQSNGINLGLDRIEKILDILDNPHKRFKSIHVAGTNGKGSVSTFISSVLKESGFKTGLYTSPHLIKFNERVKINNSEISDEDLIGLIDYIKAKIKPYNLKPTFLNLQLLWLFCIFARQEIEIAVVEVGLGGRLDATNVLLPLVSVITNIGFDHEEYLGSKIVDIAREKAGIIKPGGVLVTAEKNDEITKLFAEICNANNSELMLLDSEIIIEKLDLGFKTLGYVDDEFSLSLAGDFQIRNAATAILVLQVLVDKYGYNLTRDFIKKGINDAFISGRLEMVGNILLDGAHNPSGFSELSNYLKTFNKDIILVLGIKQGKNISDMVSLLVPFVKQIIITKSNFMPFNLDIIEQEISKYNKDIIKMENPYDAVSKARELALKDELILVTGSLYLIGNVLEILRNES